MNSVVGDAEFQELFSAYKGAGLKPAQVERLMTCGPFTPQQDREWRAETARKAERAARAEERWREAEK